MPGVFYPWFQIGEMTFDIWDNLAELLDREDRPELVEPYRPIFRNLMLGMWKLCQYDKDLELVSCEATRVMGPGMLGDCLLIHVL